MKEKTTKLIILTLHFEIEGDYFITGVRIFKKVIERFVRMKFKKLPDFKIFLETKTKEK